MRGTKIAQQDQLVADRSNLSGGNSIMDEEQLREMYPENTPVGSAEMESQRLDDMSAPIVDEPMPELAPMPNGEPQDEPLVPQLGSEQIAQTGAQYSLERLDRVQTAEDFNGLTEAQKELFYLRHKEKVAMTPKAAATYIMKRNEQRVAQNDPLYQFKMRTEEAKAIKAEREGRGEEFFANGWERYKDPQSGEIKMRIIAGSPADRAIRGSSQIKSRTAQTVISALDQAEAMVDSFGATGLIGQVTQGIDSLPAGALRSRLDLARDNIAIDRLLEMKAAGGTMGALNQSELELLKNIQGTLRVGLPAEVLKPQIQSVREMWKNVLSKMSEDDMNMLDTTAPAGNAATWTGEEKKVLGRMQYKYSDGSWRPTKPQQVK
jgi:hypothetical protein